jgi:hypothetical protein
MPIHFQLTLRIPGLNCRILDRDIGLATTPRGRSVVNAGAIAKVLSKARCGPIFSRGATLLFDIGKNSRK